jgi:hypothetical protein
MISLAPFVKMLQEVTQQASLCITQAGPINDYFGDGIGIVIKSDHNVSAVDFIFYGVRVKRPQEDTIGSTIYSSSSSFFFHQVVVQRLIWSGRGPWQCCPLRLGMPLLFVCPEG